MGQINLTLHVYRKDHLKKFFSFSILVLSYNKAAIEIASGLYNFSDRAYESEIVHSTETVLWNNVY